MKTTFKMGLVFAALVLMGSSLQASSAFLAKLDSLVWEIVGDDVAIGDQKARRSSKWIIDSLTRNRDKKQRDLEFREGLLNPYDMQTRLVCLAAYITARMAAPASFHENDISKEGAAVLLAALASYKEQFKRLLKQLIDFARGISPIVIRCTLIPEDLESFDFSDLLSIKDTAVALCCDNETVESFDALLKRITEAKTVVIPAPAPKTGGSSGGRRSPAGNGE